MPCGATTSPTGQSLLDSTGTIYCGETPLLPTLAPCAGAGTNIPRSEASRTMSAVVWTRSLPLMWLRWVSTVLMLMPRHVAIRLFELPQTTRSKICRSRRFAPFGSHSGYPPT
jgi:hypothetical protein